VKEVTADLCAEAVRNIEIAGERATRAERTIEHDLGVQWTRKRYEADTSQSQIS